MIMCTDFPTLKKLKQATAQTDFACKLIINNGIYAQLPDGCMIDLQTYSFMKASTLTKWLNVLYLIRKENAAYGDNIY